MKKITDLPVKPIMDLMRKGKRASKEISLVSMKLSEQDAAHFEEICTAGILISVNS